MQNEAVAEIFSLLSKLMDIHGENSFKSKSYSNAAFQIDRLTVQLSDMEPSDWAGLRGIGANIAAKVNEIMESGSLRLLTEYLDKTPEGVVDMLRIKGLGPKKINLVWKEMGIESIGELLYACNENRLKLVKGFGEKTQSNVREAILFMMAQQGKFLYQQAESAKQDADKILHQIFPEIKIEVSGSFRRQDDIVEQMDYLLVASIENIQQAIQAHGYSFEIISEQAISIQLENNPLMVLHSCTMEETGTKQLLLTGPDTFLEYFETKLGEQASSIKAANEAFLFSKAGLDFILPNHRTIALNESYYQKYIPQKPATVQSIKGIIHSHSQWSDGSETLTQMAEAAIKKGFEYLVISDHSQAASYAGGLQAERIILQHAEIDQLNGRLQPFRIFKSIECDILGDGSLDYNDEILQTFDLVIASVHSSLKMSEEKAMQRLITAIENPYTMILGHPTGRLLLSRKGYPIDHKKIIDACAANAVVIELNAHPRRLDLDWHWIPYALEKEVMISINPDAHSIEGYHDIYYGVIAASKALLPATQNLSSFSLEEFSDWLFDTRQMKGTL